MEFSISAIIDSIKDSLSEYDYERTKRHLGFIESSFKSQKAELALKLNNSLKDCSILNKELDHYKKDHGELLLANSESSNELIRFKTRIAEAEQEVQRLNNEVGMLKKQNMHLSEENGILEGKTMKLEEELRGFKVQCEGLKEKVVKLEEREKEENSRFEMEKARLERRLSSVMTAANERFRSFEKRVSALERVVADDDSDSGSQLIDTVLQEQDQERDQEQESCEAPHTDEKMPASMPSCPSRKAIRPTDILGQSESYESDTRPAGHVDTQRVAETLDAEENLASAMPCIYNSQSASPSVVDLTCSDDDGELPSPKGTKRKLPSAVVSTKGEEDGGSSIKYRLKHCEQKIEVAFPGESKISKKNWEYEDLLDGLQKDTELCMKAVCALYSQQMPNSFRETTLAKFLTDGNAKNGLKKTLADLKEFDPKAEDDCKRIALAHSMHLFEMYKNGKDPFFALNSILS